MSKKIKIFFFHPYSKIGGADLSIGNLINSLSSKKYDFHFICLDNPKINYYLKKNIKIHIINKSRSLIAIPNIRKIIKDNSNSTQKLIFISNQYFANIISIIALFKLKKIKKIFLERNHLDELSYYNGLLDFFKNTLIKISLKFFYKKADLIICNSIKASLDLERHISWPVKCIYNPTFIKNRFKKYKKSILKKKYIINVARFEKQKDHITLLKSFKEIQPVTNYHLMLVGHGSREEEIKKYIKIHDLKNYVKIVKNSNNPLKYIRNAELFILTSLYEGLPNVLIESIALKTPVISSDCNSGPKEILMDGKGGDLFVKKDYHSLSKKIIAHYNNPSKLKKKINFAHKNLFRFDQSNISKKFDKILSSI